MSSPRPEAPITLPLGKAYRLTIESLKFPLGFPAILSFSEDPGTRKSTASFSVPSVLLTELNCPVTQVGQEYQFSFTISKATKEQQAAGYIDGPYIFTFAPPGTTPHSFIGTVDDPHRSPEGTENNWTAEGTGTDE